MKILGVTLDKMLTFKDHISGQLKKAYAKSAALRRIRRFVPTEVMISLYNSFVLPHLEYCSPLLLGVGKVQASRLEDANFYILRSILGYGKTISYQELLGIVNMKTLEHRRICSSLLLLYKSLFCKGPRYIRDFFSFKDSTYNLRGSVVNRSMPRFNLNWMKNSFTYQVAKIWNSLEPDLRKGNLSKFAKSIKNKSF